MTRFARSKGSKSSNERLPDEATPWHIMKQQLKLTKDKEQGSNTKTKSAKQLLSEKNDPYYTKSLDLVKTDWAEFENSPSKKYTLINGKVKKKSNDQNKLKSSTKSIKDVNSSGNLSIENNTSLENIEKKYNSKEKKLKRKNNNEPICSNSIEIKQKKQKLNAEAKLEYVNNDVNNTIKKKKEKNILCDSESKQFTDTETNNDQLNKKLSNCSKNKNEEFIGNNYRLSKRQKRNQKKISNKTENINNASLNENSALNNSINNRNYNRFGHNIPRKYQKKVAKIRDNKEHSRRKPDNNSIQVTINGMDIEIVRYDGFPVIKKDAERLIELRKEMILKGIPKNDVDVAMKLERRKCEKALARIRKQVCFHCRKAGHNLSECPELEKEEIITGICFKCGSTEHTHFECKVNKSDEYRYAKCFICREQGHIAKQCPDNPKGLYPDGGSCKICGDVTHLKKDCPDLIIHKEESTITLDTINDTTLETLDNDKTKENLEIKVKQKIIKF